MKKKITLILLLISVISFSQSFTEFQNDDFKINFPKNWILSPKERMPQLSFVAYRKPQSFTDKAQVSINLNIVSTKKYTLEKTFLNLVNSLNELENFEMIENGKKNISNQPFLWLIESHTNSWDKSQKMINYVFVALKDDKTYILTMASFSEVFEDYKSVFDRIANSLIIK
jgi:hypothetical protein